MNHIAIGQILVFFTFIVYLVKKVGVLPSISDSYYRLNGSSQYFSWWTSLVGSPMMAYGVYSYTDVAQLVFALSGFCLFLVGIASNFRESMVDKFHYTGAVLAIALGFLGVWIQYHTVVPLAIFVVLAILLKIKPFRVSNYTWWIEIIAFSLIMGWLVKI
jgi:hypothetical protein